MRSLAFVALLAPHLVVGAIAQSLPASASVPAIAAKVAVIAFQQAVAQTNEGQRAFADLQKKYAPQQAELKSLSAEIETLTKQLQTQDNSLTDVERESEAKFIDEKKKQLDRETEDARNAYQTEMQALYNSLASKVYAVMQPYAEREGYTLILDVSQQQSPVLFADSANITQQVIDAYNSKSGVADLGDRPGTRRTVASSTVPAGASKIAVIAFQQAVAQTNEGQRASADLQKKYEPKRIELKNLSDEIERLNEELYDQSAQLSDAERANRARIIDEKKKHLDRDTQEAQKDFQSDMQQIIDALASKVGALMTDYAKSRGYTLVLDASGQQHFTLLYAVESANITKQIIDAYNLTSDVRVPEVSAAQTPVARPLESPPSSTTSHPGESTEAHSSDYDSQLASAMALVKAGRLTEAESAAAALVKSDPHRWEGYGLEGTIDEMEDKLIAAKAAYQHALNLAPADVKPQLGQELHKIELGANE